MDHISQISYLELLFVACGFLILQYLQIVLIARYTFSDSEGKLNDDSISARKHLNRGINPGTSRRHSHSSTPTSGYSKRRGRRTFGIKHL